MIFLILLMISSIKELLSEKVDNSQMVIGVIVEKKSSYANLQYLPTFGQVETAIDLGFEKVQEKFRRFRNYKLIKQSTLLDNEMSKAFWQIIDMLHNKTRPHVILGPVVDFNVANAVRLSDGRYQIPLLSPGGSAIAMRQKHLFQTLTSILFTFDDLKDVLLAMFKQFSWTAKPYKNVGIYLVDIVSDSKTSVFTQEVVVRTLNDANFYTDREEYREKLNSKDLDHKQKLKELAKSSRIIIICAKPEVVRQVMIAAFDLGYHKGQFAFITFDIFGKPDDKMPWKYENSTDKENEKAREAYRALLIIRLRQPDNENYKQFSNKVKNITERKYGNKYQPGEEVSPFVVSFHDAVLIYAHALNECLDSNLSDCNGLTITNMMKNITISAISEDVHIDANGDRKSDYSLLDMNKDSAQFQVVANFLASKKVFSRVGKGVIDWVNPNNMPPPDTPQCGFSGKECYFGIGTITLIVLVLSLVFIGIPVVVVIYRHFKFQIELKAMNWLIPWDAIETTEKRRARHSDQGSKSKDEAVNSTDYPDVDEKIMVEKPFIDNDSTMENHYLMSTNHDVQLYQCGSFREQRALNQDKQEYFEGGSRRPSLISVTSLETLGGLQFENMRSHQMFTMTAIYKNSIVALKPLRHSRKIEMSKSLLIEVKKVKDLNNDHLCRFIGACLETNHCFILTDYCQKGSLQDVLENDQINLDWMFKFSLIQDICRGMIYLHSNLRPHGNLKSSNCLIDSRFVVKITDFGLWKLRGSKEYLREESPYAYYRNLLWTAPEILRNPVSFPGGSLKGDVYSFGIICQEIIYRNGVFYLGDNENTVEPQDIIKYVRENRPNPFRPYVGEISGIYGGELDSLLRHAWHEDVNQRPDMRNIKLMLRKFNKSGDSGNILDNLLSRMEQYANNLEGLVTQRTEQYLEEKRKAEDLLYLMLPKSVARQLIRNEAVTAESYESVTIYFSDIVGFTSLSAESTPMQVIELLNRLYTLFDSIIENYDVYKIETIGDAYVVVSGLPQRNGNLHAREIARMSLAFLKALFSFEIPHRKDRKLQVRIGVHSGPVCAGVVGLKMPRYCLFGDTVNTASRMESNGKPMRIHISYNSMTVLKTFGTFIITERGQVEMKGKGLQTTYWLHGENDEIIDPISETETCTE